jgi:hypothetical protein
MTRFNPKDKETLTYAETLGPAMNITDPADANQYLRSYIEWLQQKTGEGYAVCERTAKANLSYFIGYYDSETSKRVTKLFNLI